MGHALDLGRRYDLEGAVQNFNLVSMGFIAPLVLPLLAVPARKGDIEVTPSANFLQQYRGKAKRPENGTTQLIQTGNNTITYNLDEYGAGSEYDKTYHTTAHPTLNPERIESRKAIATAVHALRDWEADVCDALTNETNLPPTGATGIELGTAWTDANAHPIKDVQTAMYANRVRTGGVMPNTLVISADLVPHLAANSKIRARIGGGTVGIQPSMLTAELLAQAFGLQRVLIHSGIATTADDGQAVVMGNMFKRQYATLLHVDTTAPQDDIGVLPTWGRTVVLVNPPEAPNSEPLAGMVLASMAIQVDRYAKTADIDVIRSRFFAGLLETNRTCAYLIKGVMAA